MSDSRHGLREPIQRFGCGGAIATKRLVKLDSNRLVALCGATDEVCIGATLGAIGAAASENQGVLVALKNCPGFLEVEVAAANTIATGAAAYQAANGMVASSGTVRAGICARGATAGGYIELLPDCGFAYDQPD